MIGNQDSDSKANHDQHPIVYVSPFGSDSAAGSRDEPLATIREALNVLNRRRSEGAGGEVVLADGVYALDEPLVLTPADSGFEDLDRKWFPQTPIDPVVIRADDTAKPVVSGGRKISGFRQTRVNGVDAWVVDLPDVREGRWSFTQLWVNGERRFRPRLPETGTFRIAERIETESTTGLHEQNAIFKGDDRFRYAEGDLRSFRNIEEVEFVALHFWVASRVPIASVEERTRTVHLAHRTRMNLTDNHSQAPAPYYLENVFEALERPGQWYLDRRKGLLYYIPRDGETLETTEVVAPVLDHLVRIEGDARAGRPVRQVVLDGITFSHSEHVPDPELDRTNPQSSQHVVGALSMHHAWRCQIRNCTVEHVGSYGVEMVDGCMDVAVEQCRIRDLAAGGVKIFHSPKTDEADPTGRDAREYRHCTRITVADCEISDGGHRWIQAVGVLVGRCSGVKVIHNHIHSLNYTGISIGWTWGYQPAAAFGNIIEWNHIHDIGRGVLSDMGGIYLLGQAQGTRVRFNLIHDVESRGYGGWGIYPDEGSTDLTIEYNVTYDTKFSGFHQHFGWNNLVRNNIFAFAREDSIACGRFEPHDSFIFVNNVVAGPSPRFLSGGYNRANQDFHAVMDNNVYWCTGGEPLEFMGRSFDEWQAAGFDEHTVVADPKFADAEARDLRLAAESPAFDLGFTEFSLDRVGPRPPVPGGRYGFTRF